MGGELAIEPFWLEASETVSSFLSSSSGALLTVAVDGVLSIPPDPAYQQEEIDHNFLLINQNLKLRCSNY